MAPQHFYTSGYECIKQNLMDGVIVGLAAGFGSQLVLSPRSVRLKSGFQTTCAIGIFMSGVNYISYTGKEMSCHRRRLYTFVLCGAVYKILPLRLRNFLFAFVIGKAIFLQFTKKHYFSLSVLSNYVVLWAFLNKPELIAPSYLRFLYKFTDEDPKAMQRFRDLSSSDSKACVNIHPFELNCTAAFPIMFRNTFVKHAVPFYLKVYLPFLVFSVLKSGKVSKDMIGGFLIRMMRSSLTLSAFTTFVMTGACCAGIKVPSVENRTVLLPMIGSLCGSTTWLLDTQSRQHQLIQFMLGHAASIAGRWYVVSGYAVPPQIDSILFGMSMASIIHLFNTSGLNNDNALHLLLDNSENVHKLRPSQFIS